jgi:uncharacterized protein YunC (DUF1805 family)
MLAWPTTNSRVIAAGTVAHSSGRIGDSREMWENGEISYLNDAAEAAGLKAGTMLREALTRLVS